MDCSIKEIADQVANVVNYKGAIIWDPNMPDGTPKKQLDVTRLTKMGWKAKISLREGLQDAYSDFIKSQSEKKLRE